MRIAVVGGGPAGLFFARQMKRHDATCDVDVFEQNPENATYGFGVTLAGSAQDRLRDIDPEAQDRLAAAMVFNDSQRIGLNGDEVLLRYSASGGAIARLELLTILEALSREAGVGIHHDRRISDRAELDGYDLIVGADGANSAVRALWPEGFPTTSRVLGNRFAWYGVDRALKPNALMFRYWKGGCFVAHYYAYTADMSTFVAECDAATWERCGLGRMTDDDRKHLMEEIFADVLDGGRLQDNKSIWRQFNAQIAEDWVHGNAVLIGDALRVAHFSIGSGTRLAMDDALALFEAVKDASDVGAALRAYVEKRKPNRDLFTEATVKSYEWYEDMATAMQTDVISFAHEFLVRTGRVDNRRLESYAPEFYRTHIAPRLERDSGLKVAE